jgi:capsular exopolysaccharide synthesis family protein
VQTMDTNPVPVRPDALASDGKLSGLQSNGASDCNLECELPADTRLAMLESARVLGEDRFRLLRHHLNELRGMRRLQTIVVTSAIPQDGKSTIAINTAAALADGGKKRVLLIEADLHCPSLGRTLGLEKAPGTAECLEHDSDPFLYLRKLNPLGFYFLQSGTAVANPTDLIQTGVFEGLLKKVQPHFEWVIVDTPPVCPVPDTLTLWNYVDGVLMVVRAGSTPRELADQALELAGRDRIAAIVYNGSLEATDSYYRYSSYYGGKYGPAKRQEG